MTLILDNQAVRASVDMSRLMDAVEQGIQLEAGGGVQLVPRINFEVGDGGFFRVMPGVVPALGVMGLKAFNTSAAGGVRYVIALWSTASGELLALLDAHYLTAARTGAVTGVAHRAMTERRPHDEVGVIGSGLEARTNLEAICAAGGIRRAKVFSPNAERRSRFAAEMTDRLGIDVLAVSSPEAAADAPSVLVATNTGFGSGVVALEGRWLRDATHVNTIGSTMLTLREVDGATFGRADVVVLDTPHAPSESGDLQAAISEGHWDEAKVRSLAEVVDARANGANGGGALTVFKSVGTALQDIVAAKQVYEIARERGLGRTVEFLEEKFF
jgi:alanine dehydrogenase